MNRFTQLWENLRGSFWFLPTAMVVAALIGGTALVELDFQLGNDLADRFPRIFATSAEGARGILESIASSMITVAGVTFSITILILAQTGAQYSPRIIRSFIRDRRNQAVLGVFVSVFVYCLVVLRSIRDIDDLKFVPHLAVLGGIVLALAAIAVLIFFIHHVAYSIQATTILERAAEETLAEIDNLYPEPLGEGMRDLPPHLPEKLRRESCWHPVLAKTSGYLGHASADGLLKFAEKHDSVVRLEVKVGEFVVESTPVASLYGEQPPEKEVGECLLALLSITPYRTVEQDAGFGIRQLVDIGLRSLSPGINDTTTANMCLDRLTIILVHLVRRETESPFRKRNGELRAILRRPTFAELLGDCLEQIRQCGEGNVRILLQLTQVIRTVALQTGNPARLDALKLQLELVRDTVSRTIPCTADRDRLFVACDTAFETISSQRG